MNCLYCHKSISEEEYEGNQGWHKSCAKKFFGCEQVPVLELSDRQLELLANKTVAEGFTVPGVQRKISVHLSKDEHPRLTVVDYPAGYILKAPHFLYPHITEFEDAAMRMAEAAGIQVVPFGLLPSGADHFYITKRIDRKNNRKLAMEDFAQLTGRLTSEKYNGSYEHVGKRLKALSSKSGLDLTTYFLLVVFSFVIGNSDMHLKNLSLIETKPGNRQFIFSESYDIVPANILLTADLEQMALTVNGKKKNLHRKDFLQFGKTIGLQDVQIERLIQSVLSHLSDYFDVIEQSLLSDEEKEKWKKLIQERAAALQKSAGSPAKKTI